MTGDEEIFRQFQKHWLNQEPTFQLDDPSVREDVMTVVSAMMSLLAVGSKPTWETFMNDCREAAKKVPQATQAKIKIELPPR